MKAVSAETRVSVDNYVNRILSKDIFAEYDNPLFDNSAIDGFALNEDTKSASKNFFLREGLLKPGVEPNVILKKNEGIKILTGFGSQHRFCHFRAAGALRPRAGRVPNVR